jgi:hypothetical protein
MSSNRFCHHCGAKVELPGAEYCSVCGRPLLAKATPDTRPPADAPAPPKQHPKDRRGNGKPAPHPRAAERRRFGILRLTTLFGLFDLVAIIIAAAGLAVWQLKPETTSCEPLEPPASHTVVDSLDVLQGDVKGFSVLEAGKTYTVAAGKSLTIPDGATLLIQPGARLAFEQGAALDVHGWLHACGTSRDTIVFTSSLDAEDSSGKQPKAGDWIGIRFFGGSDDRSVIGNAHIRYAGYKNHGAIHLEGSSPRVAGVTISDCAWFPISLDADANPTLGGQIKMVNVPYTAIEVRKSTLTHNMEWADTERVYAITDNVTVGSNATLTVRPGVAIKFAAGKALIVEGRLQAVGELKDGAQGIVLTSMRDDQVRGDTDLAAANPEAGDWLGVVFRQSSQGSVLRGVTIKYAGNAEHGVGAIHLENTSPEIIGNEITHCAGYAVSADVNSFPTIQGNRLEDVARGNGLGLRKSELATAGSYRWDNVAVDMVRVVTSKITVGANATLTIAPGTVIKFANDGSLDVSGFLHAEGGEGDDMRIVFTSVHDDDYGGDTDGSTDPQATRNWGWIILRGSDPSTSIRRVVIRYAGVALAGASPQIVNNELIDTGDYPIKANPASDPVVQGNTVRGNILDGMEIQEGDLTKRGEWSWDNAKVTMIRVVTGRLTVGPETILVIRPATTVKFSGKGQFYIKGALRIEGQEKQEVVLTSWRDDQHGGDTDRSAVQPQPGEWQGIVFDGNSSDAASTLQYAIVRYATSGLSLTDSSPPIRDVRIDHCSSKGLACDNRSEPALERVTLEDNAEAGTNCPGWGGAP